MSRRDVHGVEFSVIDLKRKVQMVIMQANNSIMLDEFKREDAMRKFLALQKKEVK